MEIPNCKLCKQPFDLCEYVPLVLPNCGHTYCQICLTDRLEKDQVLSCPEDNRVV